MLFKTNHSAVNRSVTLSLILFTLLVILEIQLLTHHPWLGLKLYPTEGDSGLSIKAINHPDLLDQLRIGDTLIAIRSDSLPNAPLQTHALVDDPDNYPTLQQYNAAFEHNAAIYQRLSANTVTLTIATGREIQVYPLSSRPTFSLPANFWITNLTALIGLLFAAVLWAYKQQNTQMRLLQASGVFFCIASTTSAIYASRGLALDPTWYSTLTAINHLAMPIVSYSLLALVLIYPHRLVSHRLAVADLLIPVALWLNTVFQWTDLPLHTFYLGMIVAFLLGIPPSIRQWQLSKDKPVERAALKWMLLSIFIASGSVVIFYFGPTIFGAPPVLPLWAAQLIFLPLYIGFVMGVLRCRLFDVDRWWLISWQWMLSGLLIISIDLLLVSILHINQPGALSIAMIIVAWAYFPLRQWLWRKIGYSPNTHLENHIHDFIRIFIGTDPKHHFRQRWQTLLQSIFAASSAEIGGGSIHTPRIGEHGMNMLIPGINGNFHIDLYGRNHSTRLFSKQDISLAQKLTELAIHTKTIQQAREDGAKRERNRIMRDLHDDVGANLLSMIYRAKDEAGAELAKETLTLLRETIYTLDDNTTTRLPLAIAKWRQEIKQRCLAADVRLDWQVDDMPVQYGLTARQFVNLGRVLRETVTNALKHAQPAAISVSFVLQNGQLDILLSHDGHVPPPQSWTEGKGIPGMRTRMRELQGNIVWKRQNNRLQTCITLPLTPENPNENHA